MGSSIKYGEFISVDKENKDETKEYICLNTPMEYTCSGGEYGNLNYYQWRFEDFLERHKDCKHLPPVYYFGPMKKESEGKFGKIKDKVKDKWSEWVNTEVWDGDYPTYDKGTPIVRESYGHKYIVKFSKYLMPKLSDEGKKWLIKARILLQEYMDKGLCDKEFYSDFDKEYNKIVAVKGLSEVELDSKYFQRFAFATHPDAYINAGLFELDIIWDKIEIGTTPDMIEWMNLGTMEQALIVGIEQIKNYDRQLKDKIKKKIDEIKRKIPIEGYKGVEKFKDILESILKKI